MAGIMDFFKPSTPSTTSNSTNPPTGGENKDLSSNNPATGPDGKMPGTDPNTVNPLDTYNKMFDTANNNSDIQAPTFKIDSKVLNDVSGKMDFTRGISQEVLQKATTGDVTALMDIIKTVGQNSYKAAIDHSTSLTDTFMTQRSAFEDKRVQDGVRTQLTTAELSNAPNYSHPVVKAELNRIANQFAKANPDASPQEVAKAAQKYISDLQNALNPTSNSNSSDIKETDWTKYLNG